MSTKSAIVIEKFSVGDLRRSAAMMRHMRDNGSNIVTACEKYKAADQSLDSARRIFKEFRATVTRDLEIRAFVARGGNGRSLYLTEDTAELRKVESLLSQIDAIVAASANIGNLKSKLEVPEVRIGTMSTVISYLLPALLWRLRSLCKEEKRTLPHVTMYQGETGQQFQLLLQGKLDFVLQRSSVKVPHGIESQKLNYWTKEQGVVFRRYRITDSSIECFPKLMHAIERDRIGEFVAAMEEYPLILIHKDLDDQFDSSFAENLQQLFFQTSSRKRASSGQRIFVPTSRHERQLMHLGLGVSIGHIPGNIKPTSWSIKGVPVSLGNDQEYPKHSLVYVPMSIFNSTKLEFDSSPQQFAIFRRAGEGKQLNGGMENPYVGSVLDALEHVTKIPSEEFNYLEYQKIGTETCLVHTFDFSGHIVLSKGIGW